MYLLLQLICGNCQYIQRSYDSAGLGKLSPGLSVRINLNPEDYYCRRCDSIMWTVEAKLVKSEEVVDQAAESTQLQATDREEFYLNWQATLDREQIEEAPHEKEN